jgi:hypothetical protein
MGFSQAIKMFQYNLLRRSGVNISPTQVGLKLDANGQLSGSFASILANNTQQANGLTIPEMPELPTDPTDTVAQQEYQNQLLEYQQNMQAYNQRYMQVMMSQFQRQLAGIQQALAAQKSTDSSLDASAISGFDSSGGTGSIIDI